MSRRDKLIEFLHNNPKNGRFEDVDKLLIYFNFECRQSHSGTSHFVYIRKGYMPITIARHRPFIHEQAVKEVIRIIDEILETEEE